MTNAFRQFLTSLFFFLSVSSVTFSEVRVETFSSYDVFQKKIVELIGTAKNRIWIASRSLDAYAITDALYYARSRKVDVKLLLGPISVHSTNGRALLNLFVSQKIFFMLDQKMRVESTTGLLVDDSLIWANTTFGEAKSQAPFTLEWYNTQNKALVFRQYFEEQEKLKEWDQFPSVFDYETRPTEEPTNVSKKLPKQLKNEQ